MEVLYGNLDTVLPTIFTGVTAYGFLVFSALYTPCIAALATMRKEYGNKMMFISFAYQFALAWIAALLVNLIGNILIGQGGSASIIEILVAGIIIVTALVIILKKFTSKSQSSGCNGCSGCASKNSCTVAITEENKADNK